MMRRWLMAVMLVALAACSAVGPDYRRPAEAAAVLVAHDLSATDVVLAEPPAVLMIRSWRLLRFQPP